MPGETLPGAARARTYERDFMLVVLAKSGRYDYLPSAGWVLGFIALCFIGAFVIKKIKK